MDKLVIVEDLLPEHMNRPMTPLVARAIVSHRTGNPNPGANAKANRDYFASAVTPASAHYIVDKDTILRDIPENEEAWGAGIITNPNWHMGNPNHWAIHVELCENYPFMSPEGDMAYRKYVDIHADICLRRGLNPELHIFGHFMIDPVDRGDDPKGMFNWDMFIRDVKNRLAYISNGASVMENFELKQQRDRMKLALRGIAGLASPYI